MTKRFEDALQKTQTDIDVALKAAKASTAVLKKIQKATQTGDIKPMTRLFELVDESMVKLADTINDAREGWDFDADTYFSEGEYFQELIEEAKETGVSLFEMDGRVFCYPCILKLLPNDRVVTIDKKREKNLRPSVFVKKLHAIQSKPPKFKPATFLESLYMAYSAVVAQKGEKAIFGNDIKLLEIYKVLTILPGIAREYSKQDFARDIYLLDQSNIKILKTGFEISFPSASGTKNPSQCLRIITRDGQEKLYHSIAFNDVN
ncbi:hypothetical protein K8T06_02415 [bacterium]|nr:hypothetical protein [bacterium]